MALFRRLANLFRRSSAMLALGLAATWAPAQRALLADPSRLMREE
jgi:ABC-type lipoprotein release transport system permease subunit